MRQFWAQKLGCRQHLQLATNLPIRSTEKGAQLRAFFLFYPKAHFQMRRFTKQFAADETGAIAVDWLLLTATAIGLAIGGLSMMQGNAADLTEATIDAQADRRSFTSP